MHFSIYARLLDLLWEHLDDEIGSAGWPMKPWSGISLTCGGRWMKECDALS